MTGPVRPGAIVNDGLTSISNFSKQSSWVVHDVVKIQWYDIGVVRRDAT